MPAPLVSLLVPIYNVERYLRECLDSAKNQTLKDIEIICINDGSTDSSPDIIREYMAADQRFRMIDKPNSGYGSSMNMGLKEATGKYVGILESDDFFEPNALEALFNAAERHNAQVAKANFWFYWSVPQEKDEFFELVTPDMANRPFNPQEEFDIYYKKPSIWSALYRRDYLEEHTITFLETPGASYQDAGFNFKVWANATCVTFLHEGILHYRQDNEASSVNSPTKVYCVCDEYAEMERFLDAHPEKAYLKPVEEKMKYDSYMWNYDRLAEPLRREFIVRFAEEFKKDTESGVVDLSLFEPWKQADLALMLEDPMLFHVGRQAQAGESAMTKMARYYKAGGFSLLSAAIRNKTRKR